MKYYILILLAYLSYSSLMSQTWKGSGTEADPYQITTIMEFQDIGKKSGKYFILMNDIDASETRNRNVGDHDNDSSTPDEPMGFVPLLLDNINIDGRGYVIKNLYINLPAPYNAALIDYASYNSKIKKLGLEDCDITGRFEVASFCYCSEGSSIEECYSTGKINVLKTNEPFIASAFCQVNKGDIHDCYTQCSVTCDSDTNYAISGFNNSNYWLWNCYSTGKMNTRGKVSFFMETENMYHCYWDTETTGISNDGNIKSKGLPTSEMMKQSTFVGWDFDKIWYIDEGKSYPKLRAFGDCPTGVEDIRFQTNPEMEISPNPATDYIEIFQPSESLKLSEGLHVRIYNVFGQEVYPSPYLSMLGEGESTPFNSPASGGQLKIDISGLPSGVYFVRVGERVGRFVKI